MQVDIELTGPQKEFCTTSLTNPAFVGGLGSGKSRGGTMRLILLIIADKGTNGGYYMPTYDLLKLRAIVGIEDDLKMLGLSYTLNKSDYFIDIHGYGKIIFRSYDRPERIIAYETAHSIVDELDTLPRDKAAVVWRKISERNRQKCKGKNTIGCVTTPDQGYSGFIYEKWYKLKQEGYGVIKAPTYSNPYLPDGYVQQIRDNYDPLLAEMYIEGEIVNLSRNKVYHYFDRTKHNSDRLIKPDDHLHIGLDFNVGGCVANVWVLDDGYPVAVDEFISRDTMDICNNIIARYKGNTVTVYPDASGQASRTNASQTDIDIIRSYHMPVNVGSTNPAVKDRINAMNKLMAYDNLKVNCSKCPELAYALESQGYNDKGEPQKFNEHPAIDDYCDSAGYFIHRRFPIAKPAIAPRFG